MKRITTLCWDENIELDPSRIHALIEWLGPETARDIVKRAMEELADRLGKSHHLYLGEEWRDFRKCIRSMIAIGDQIGMISLTKICADVLRAVDRKDAPAIAATLYRLLRIGDRSIADYWELQIMSG